MASEPSWSLFKLGPPPAAVDCLTAFYGWRRGRGPLVPVGYVTFSEEELSRTGGRLVHTPHNFEWGWPPDVRLAHYDLVDQNQPDVERLLNDTQAMAERLVWIPRVEMLASQVALARRSDAPHEFRERVSERCRKLFRNERAVFDELNRALETKITDAGRL